MALVEEFQSQGNWLFRWRSYLPLVLLVLLGVAIQQSRFPLGRLWIHEVWEEFCLGVSFLGLLVRALAIGYAPSGTSGRNTHKQIADSLNSTGIYSIVRHPLYLGNFLIGFGISLVEWVWWLPVIYTLVFCIYYERIMFAEEAFLHHKFGSEFDHWAAETPAFWPRFSHWRRPSLSFSLRNVLRREYTGLLVVILGHAGLEFAEHSIYHQYVWQGHWTVFVLGGVATYLVLRTLKKRTSLLEVAGR
jgi:protein-S-isoprenylcysteine O-methyltransferase Ste14